MNVNRRMTEQISHDSLLVALAGPKQLGVEGCLEFIEGLNRLRIRHYYWNIEAVLLRRRLLKNQGGE